jgi:putative ABC transport system substrate-binding protein
VKRRDFITLLGGAAAWPLVARAQQGERMRRIGALMSVAADDPEAPDRVGAFSQGLAELGWTIGRNLRIDYRWFGGDADAARKYSGIGRAGSRRRPRLWHPGRDGNPTGQSPRAGRVRARRRSTRRRIRRKPGAAGRQRYPVKLGLVTSIARPGGNVTGVNILSAELAAKRLELLRELVPGATRVVVLVNPTNATNTESTLRDVEPAARAMGLQIQVLEASTSREINLAFATFEYR